MRCFYDLLAFLHDVQRGASSNMMTAENLAICFAPNVLLIDADSPSRNFDVIGRASKSVYLQLITHIPHTGPGFPRAGVAIPVTVEPAAEGAAELASV